MKTMTLSVVALIAAAGVVLADPQPGDGTTKQPPKKEGGSVPAQRIKAAPSEGQPKKDQTPASLKVGDAAPTLKIDAWVKGEEVKSLEKGKVYVVEFWATWCGPCVKMFPHLTKLQKDHPELTVIGVAASERAPKDGGKDTRLDKLKDFVSKQGDNMGYRVAYDSDREMSKDWMQAAKQSGIPCAFVVDHEGKVAYIGHPASMDASVVKALKAAAEARKTASAN